MASDASTIGQHALIDLYGKGEWGDAARLEEVMRAAATTAGATVIGAHFHHFGEGNGVTGVLMLAESHISVHTWPERDYAAFDIFMCGSADIDAAIDVLSHAFSDCRADTRSLDRGRG